MLDSLNSFWNGDGKWKGYKATTIVAGIGLASTLVDYYWVFTSTPLAGASNDGLKTIYMLGLILLNMAKFGCGGLVLDYARSIYDQVTTETLALNR